MARKKTPTPRPRKPRDLNFVTLRVHVDPFDEKMVRLGGNADVDVKEAKRLIKWLRRFVDWAEMESA